jgi:hypothetical protein
MFTINSKLCVLLNHGSHPYLDALGLAQALFQIYFSSVPRGKISIKLIGSNYRLHENHASLNSLALVLIKPCVEFEYRSFYRCPMKVCMNRCLLLLDSRLKIFCQTKRKKSYSNKRCNLCQARSFIAFRNSRILCLFIQVQSSNGVLICTILYI